MHNHAEDPREQPKRTIAQAGRRAALNEPAATRAQLAQRERRPSALAGTITVALEERDATVAVSGQRAIPALLTWTDAEGLTVRGTARLCELAARCGVARTTNQRCAFRPGSKSPGTSDD